MSAQPSLLDYLSEPDVDRLADVIADLLIAGARRQAATDTAESSAKHEATPSPTKSRRRFEEDGPREPVTLPDQCNVL